MEVLPEIKLSARHSRAVFRAGLDVRVVGCPHAKNAVRDVHLAFGVGRVAALEAVGEVNRRAREVEAELAVLACFARAVRAEVQGCIRSAAELRPARETGSSPRAEEVIVSLEVEAVGVVGRIEHDRRLKSVAEKVVEVRRVGVRIVERHRSGMVEDHVCVTVRRIVVAAPVGIGGEERVGALRRALAIVVGRGAFKVHAQGNRVSGNDQFRIACVGFVFNRSRGDHKRSALVEGERPRLDERVVPFLRIVFARQRDRDRSLHRERPADRERGDVRVS